MKNFGKKRFQVLHFFIFLSALMTLACEKSARSFSLEAASNTFEQSQGEDVNNKIDILWIVDGSGTMKNHQDNLANNFNSFITGFVNKGFDYHMAVASTDGWLREVNYNGGGCSGNPNPSNNPDTKYRSSADCNMTVAKYGDLTYFRDGDIYGTSGTNPGTRSGTFLITSLMDPSEILNLFSINVRTGTRGDGTREAGFQSLRSVLRRNEDGSVGYNGETHTALADFRRPDAFLAVIIVSDEEDQSRKQDGSTYANINEYTQSFVSFMDGYTGSVEGNRNYNISGFVLDDINNCQYGLHDQANQGDKYVAIANATDGIVSNICNPDFSSQLDLMAEKIVSLSTRFQLDREPDVSTIMIKVNGADVPKDPTHGWTYIVDSGFFYIEFRGSAVPPQGATINVYYDPLTIKQD